MMMVRLGLRLAIVLVTVMMLMEMVMVNDDAMNVRCAVAMGVRQEPHRAQHCCDHGDGQPEARVEPRKRHVPKYMRNRSWIKPSARLRGIGCVSDIWLIRCVDPHSQNRSTREGMALIVVLSCVGRQAWHDLARLP